MKLGLIGPGIMNIPTNTWGAVEDLIWNYYLILNQLGWQVEIINDPNIFKIVSSVNYHNFDVVHLHYDQHYTVLPHLKCKSKIISSHYPYINLKYKWVQDGYESTFRGICNSDAHIFASSKEDINTFVKDGCVDPARMWHSRLGVKYGNYKYDNCPAFDRTLCLGKITDRKRQWSIQNNKDIDFIGKMDYGRFNNRTNYLGEMLREELNNTITKYCNSILLSEAENATPLVIKESLICGLGVVVSECCALELDKSLPFIHVITNDKLDDIDYIESVLNINKSYSVRHRNEIRQYGIDNFALETILKNEYIPKLESLI
jgi:hypothetical protein